MMACVAVLFLCYWVLMLEVGGREEKFAFARKFCSCTGGLLCPGVWAGWH